MNLVVAFLTSSPLLLLFAVIGLGYLVGSIRFRGFSLGAAAVLFAGIFFGALDSRLRIPDIVYLLGLVLFVYTIGLQSGPTFFSSFGKRAFRANVFAFGAIVLAAVMTYAAWGIFGLDGPAMVGVFSGSLTNTPSLAASVEVIKHVMEERAVSAGELLARSNAPVIGYSVSYPFGVIGVLLAFHIVGKRLAMKRREEKPNADVEQDAAGGPITAQTYRVVNPGVIGKSVSGVFSLDRTKGFVLSRLRRGTMTSLVYPETVFEKDDLVVAVGDAKALGRALELFGEESTLDIRSENQEFDYRRIEVSDGKVIGRTVAELNLQKMLDATITRIRRGDTDFVPTGGTVLERGDRIRVLTWAGNLDRIARFFGDSVRGSSETDFLSLSIGIAAGVLLGLMPIALPGGSTFTLGFAGGPLIAGLILGRLQRSGSITWTMPFSVNLTLRQVGLVLFLAGIGTKAGDGFLHTVAEGGWKLMAVGACVTTVVTCTTLVLGTRLLRLSVPAVMGLMSGIQTQPACLAFANEQTPSNVPNVWYASVYPVSMISKIILAQLLVARLL